MRALLAERGGGPSSADEKTWSEEEKAQVSWLGLGLGFNPNHEEAARPHIYAYYILIGQLRLPQDIGPSSFRPG